MSYLRIYFVEISKPRVTSKDQGVGQILLFTVSEESMTQTCATQTGLT